MSSTLHISSRVQALVKKYQTADPFALCRMLHIRVHYTDLGPSMKAYYFYQSRIKTIVLNTRCSDTVQKVLCAHELGHAILHSNLANMYGFHETALLDRSVPTEYEANLFAAELLVPDKTLFAFFREPDKTFYDIACELSIPSELLDFKFRILNHKGYHLAAPCTARSNFLKNIPPNNFQ
jgi:Zn-dependent peptidase ImmA (M78 family)